MGRFKYLVVLILFIPWQAGAFDYKFKELPSGEIKACKDAMYRCYNLVQFKKLILLDTEFSQLKKENKLLEVKIEQYKLMKLDYLELLNVQKQHINILDDERKRLTKKWKDTDLELQNAKGEYWPWVVTGVAILAASFAVGYGVSR